MLQRFDKPRLGMFLISLLLITLLQMMAQQARAAAFTVSDSTHPCIQTETGVQQGDASGEMAQSSYSCCETPDCHNPACQNLCALGNAVTALGLFALPIHFGGDIYHTFPVVSFSDALAKPPFHPPRYV